MVNAAVILSILAAIFAALSPAAYGLFFAACRDWSAIVSLTTACLCPALAVSSFKQKTGPAWFVSFAWITAVSLAGFVHHFQDSGESGPLPFEWVNRYARSAAPLVLLSVAIRMYLRKRRTHLMPVKA